MKRVLIILGLFIAVLGYSQPNRICYAINQGDYALVDQLIKEGYSIAEPCQNGHLGGNNVLSLAVSKGNLEITKLLIDNGALDTIKDIFDLASSAVRSKNLELVKYLLDNVKIEIKEPRYVSRSAVSTADDDIMKYILIEKGIGTDTLSLIRQSMQNADIKTLEFICDLYQVDFKSYRENDYDPLEIYTNYTVTSSSVDTTFITYLLNLGFDINKKDKRGNTPFLNLVSRSNLETIKFLLRNGSDINSTNSKGETVSDLLLKKRGRGSAEVRKFFEEMGLRNDFAIFDAIDDQDYERVSDLIQEGYDINYLNNGENCLEYAIKKDDLYLVQLLVSLKIEFSIDESAKYLSYAVRNGHNSLVRYLVSLGLDINAKDDRGRPVCFSVFLSNGSNPVHQLSMLKLLSELGADLKAVDENNLSILEFTNNNYRFDIVKYLVEEQGLGLGESYEKSAMRYCSNDLNELKFFIEKATFEIDFNEIFRRAAYGNNKEVMTYLLDNDKIEINNVYKGTTILMNSSLREETLQYLLRKGADINLQNEDGSTALMFHCMDFRGYDNTIKLIIDNGADINIKDNDGWTALDYLVEYHFKDEVTCGEFEYVSDNPYTAIKKYLLAKGAISGGDTKKKKNLNRFRN